MWISASAIQSHRVQLRLGRVDSLVNCGFQTLHCMQAQLIDHGKRVDTCVKGEGSCYKVSGQRPCRIALGIAMGAGHTSLKMEDVLPGQLSLTESIWTIFYIAVLRLQQHYVYPEFFSCSFPSQPRET